MEETIEFREAKKFLGLIEAFEVSTEGMEENLRASKDEIRQKLEVKETIPPELTMSLIDSEEFLSDFILVRESLREDIKVTKLIISRLGNDIASTHVDDLSGNMVLAFAELKKGNVVSMKLLMDSYSSVAETQLKIKKLISEIETIENNTKDGIINIQNNFIGSAADIMKKLKDF